MNRNLRTCVRISLVLFSLITACNFTTTPTPIIPTITTSPTIAPPINHPPSAQTASLSISLNTPTALDLKTLASDPDSDPLTFAIQTDPEHGTATLVTGVLTFTPTADYFGTDRLIYTVSDGQGGIAQAAITVTVSMAPPLDTSVATDIASSTEFLYTGNHPIQTGVVSGTIEARRVAVLRGKVLSRDGSPLTGVTITILDHPEFGQTLSRADGMFDLAVNGGGTLTVNYAKTEHLPVQRQVMAPWRDFSWLPNVVMIQVDDNETVIDLTASIAFQVARGRIISDTDGSRQQTLLFPEGNTAVMTLPNGTTQTLTRLTVRSTEYTVGANGLETMPAQLPANSAYTYAAEFSVDEVVNAGASGPEFSKAIISYNENFLNFPVGAPIPLGYYDTNRGVWVSSDNGRVVKLLSIASGIADLDIDGSGIPATAVALTALGITDAERTTLASLYTAGQSLWRTPIRHFSTWNTWDMNQGTSCEEPCPAPEVPDPKDPLLDSPTFQCGSIIGCESQTLGEVIGVTGTPFSLHYQSDRVPGLNAAFQLRIPLSGPDVSQTKLKRIEIEVEVAGQITRTAFGPVANLDYTHTWDGRDAYGRTLQGKVPVTVRLTYVYRQVYQTTTRFGYNGGGRLSVGPGGNRAEFRITRLWKGTMGGWDARAQGLGGWTLNVNHAYDPGGTTLLLGDGTRRTTQSLPDILTPVTVVGLSVAHNIAVGPDGSIYIPSRDSNRVLRVWPDGTTTTVAGMSTSGGFSGDGGLATEARLSIPQGVAIGPDGSLYIADTGNNRIRKVGLDGIISTVAGNGTGDNGTAGFLQEPGGVAIQLTITNPIAVAVGPDGSLYIADHARHRIRRVGTDGIMTTFAGTGSGCVRNAVSSCGDGGPARQATFNEVAGLTVASDGAVYIADQNAHSVRRVGADGIITTLAGGSGERGFSGDGLLATQARLNFPTSVSLGPDGSLYISDTNNQRIRRVSTNGVITTVVGGGPACGAPACGFGGPATQARLAGSKLSAQVAPDGALIVLDAGNNGVVRVAPAMAGVIVGDHVLAAEDGSEVYIFNSAGRHLRTVNALTEAKLYDFTYDSSGRLVKITDGNGNSTSITRDTNGKPINIVGPYGQTTALTLDANGYLTSVTNPAQESVQLTYTASGLLTSLVDPRGNTHSFAYNDLGRLIRDANPAAGVTTLNRVDATRSYTVTLSTALNRTTAYLVENLPNGDERRVTTFPNGLQSESLKKPDGTLIWSDPDGTTQTVTLGPDPRWGMLAPVNKNISLTTPSGLTYTMQVTRTAVLNDPRNPFSLVTLVETTIINGKTYTSTYTAATRTWVERSPTGRIVTTRLDALGRVVFEQVAGLAPTIYTYDPRGQLVTATLGTGTEARAVTFTYNSAGYLASVTDPLNRTANFDYDLAGRVITQTLPDGRVIGYAYDASGNLTGLTPPGRPIHNFSYTPIDLPAQYMPPDVNPAADNTDYTYNADRQLTLSTYPDGQTTSLSYDSAGRLNALTIARGMFSYSYDSTTGNLATITAPGGIDLAYTYDGGLLTGTTWSGPIAGSVGYTYDNNFRLTSSTVNASSAIAFQYDDDSLLTQAGTLNLGHNAQNSLLTTSTLGSVADTWSYNGFAEPTHYSAAYNATPLYNVQYDRDKLGRISQKTETIGGVTTTYGYTYDLTGRLTTVMTNGVTSASYAYDNNGNRLSYTSPTGVVSGTYDAQDRLLQNGTTTYTYTANGELLTKTKGAQITRYQYDTLGNLISVTLPNSTQIAYAIDGQNRRIGKRVNDTLVQGFIYEDDLRLIAELDGSNNIVSRFIYANYINVPDYMVKGSVTYRIILDQVGSVRLVINTANGQIAQRMDYDEFGLVLKDTNPGFQPFGFAGGLYDRDTKLVRFGARDYDAEAGRWTTKDPIGFSGGDTSLYGYVLNNPVNWFDPSGQGLKPIPGQGPKPNLCQGIKPSPWVGWKRTFELIKFILGVGEHINPMKEIPKEPVPITRPARPVATGGKGGGPGGSPPGGGLFIFSFDPFNPALFGDLSPAYVDPFHGMM